MSDEFRSDLALYHEISPDQYNDGCQVSGQVEPGVVFPQIEVMNSDYCFIGRTAITEATAMLYDLTPGQVIDRLTREKSLVANLQAKLAEQEEALKGYEELFSRTKAILLEDSD